MQTPSTVLRWNERWSLEQRLVPRTLFPRAIRPLVFVLFTKDRRRKLLGGFLLYRESAEVNRLGKEAKLLLVHGSGDDNVHYQGTERLVNRLVELGKPFDLMVYPNRTHAIAEGPGTTAHVYQLIARYFLQHLPPNPQPETRTQER